MTGFVELCATTNFSFLHGGSHPEEMVSASGASGERVAKSKVVAKAGGTADAAAAAPKKVAVKPKVRFQ
ncbi:hypothetical protein EON68_02565 [archaeon]|nr:MAG: hypothetical protein EON68_02565 [archaeon]